MTTRRVELENGSAHQKLTVNLAQQQIDLRLNWLTRFGYYSVDISLDGERVASGRGLHPETDLIEGTDIEGRLFLRGEQPTPDNLNQANRLLYEEPGS